MLLYISTALLAGYILNEESSLNRICKNLSHPHLGWCLIKYELTIWAMVGFFILSFLKSWGFAIMLRESLHSYWGLPATMYLFGNIFAVMRSRGLFYTPWIVLMGLMLARDVIIFQASLTALCTALAITKDISVSVDIWLVTMVIFILFFISFPESICWLSTITLTYIFSGRHSPFLAAVIK